MKLQNLLIVMVAAMTLCSCGDGSLSSSKASGASQQTASTGTAKSPEISAAIEPDRWVVTERLDRRTCPAKSCGVVGRLFFREGVTSLEERKGWVRITKPYDAACESGKSRYVDSGPAACTPQNGIVDGQFAEWVEKAHLSKVQPADPALTATFDEAAIAQSDDFARHRKGFAKLAKKLIADGRCTEADLKEQGGFMKSVNQYRDEPVYFTYCGGMSLSNKVYVNAVTGEILP